MNPAVEIARILLEFEIERQQKAAAASQVSEAQDATAATEPTTKATRLAHSSLRRGKVKEATH